jgi:hypothetical protein
MSDVSTLILLEMDLATSPIGQTPTKLFPLRWLRRTMETKSVSRTALTSPQQRMIETFLSMLRKK